MRGFGEVNGFFLAQKCSVVFFFSLLISLFGWQAQGAEGDSACSSCHDQGQKVVKSVHAGLTCDTCHENHERQPHPAGTPKPACATCHAEQASAYEGSVHGQAAKKGAAAPDCAVCHGSAHEALKP